MRILMIVGGVFICFVLESVFSAVFGRWFSPNLLLLLVIFINLFRGIRYSIFTAVLAGIFKDSYSLGPFGLSIFSLVVCAYLTTVIKMYIYQPGSMPSRVLLVFVMTVIYVGIMAALAIMSTAVNLGDIFLYVFIPEVVATTMMTGSAFRRFRQCALSLSA